MLHKIRRQPCRKIYKIYHKKYKWRNQFLHTRNCTNIYTIVKLYGYTRICMDTLETVWIH